MEVRVGDIYIRHKDEKLCRVKSIDHMMVVLESCEEKTRLILTDIFSLEKAFIKKESEPI